MSPIHFRFLAPALSPMGYDIRLIHHLEAGAVDEGLRLVNNDACFPALVSIGQIIHELKRMGAGDRVGVLMSQTGGGCRASNYIGFLRKALEDSGMGHVPVLPFSLSGSDQGEGLVIDRAGWKRILVGLLTGDTLQRLVLSTRPNEREKGASEALLDRWTELAARPSSIPTRRPSPATSWR